MTEIIAACGWESIAPEPGRFSFTDTLIKVLEEWIDRPFTAAMLHSEILSRLKHERPEMIGNRRVECRRTPIYIVSTSDLSACSIELSRVRADVGQTCNSRPAGLINFGVSPPSANGVERGINSPSAGGELTVPHVLISIALEEDQTLDSKACSQWLCKFPALAKYATVQGVFRSHSTLVLLAVPVVIWDLLPQNAACSFIAYVRSTNLLQSSWGHNVSHAPCNASPDKVSSGVLAKVGSNLALYTNFSSISRLSAIFPRSFGSFFRGKLIYFADADARVDYMVSNCSNSSKNFGSRLN